MPQIFLLEGQNWNSVMDHGPRASTCCMHCFVKMHNGTLWKPREAEIPKDQKQFWWSKSDPVCWMPAVLRFWKVTKSNLSCKKNINNIDLYIYWYKLIINIKTVIFFFLFCPTWHSPGLDTYFTFPEYNTLIMGPCQTLPLFWCLK